MAVTALMLFGTSGLAISRMTCLMAGHTVVSIGATTDCCPEKEHAGTPTVAAECCVMDQAKADPMPFLSGNPVLLPLVAVVEAHPPLLTIDGLHRPADGASDRAPPLLLPADRLAMLSVLRV